jgi:C-terminal processing protease CtpA/Prc
LETVASETLTLDNYAVTTLDSGVVWIRLPSFSGDPDTGAVIAELAEQIATGRKAMRAAPAIVLDVRGNSGGSSFNGDQIVEALWTRAELRRRGPRDKPIRIGWRASAENLEYWKDWTKAQAERGEQAGSEAAYGERIVAGLQGAIARGDVLWTESSVGKNPPVARRTGRKPLFAAKVYMLSDGTCASACLDFADRALHMPGVSLIGADTSGDGLLMEIRIERSPSGMASAKIAQKIYLNRRRGHLETYSADIEHTGAWDDAAVVAWVQSLLAEDR